MLKFKQFIQEKFTTSREFSDFDDFGFFGNEFQIVDFFEKLYWKDYFVIVNDYQNYKHDREAYKVKDLISSFERYSEDSYKIQNFEDQVEKLIEIYNLKNPHGYSVDLKVLEEAKQKFQFTKKEIKKYAHSGVWFECLEFKVEGIIFLYLEYETPRKNHRHGFFIFDGQDRQVLKEEVEKKTGEIQN